MSGGQIKDKVSMLRGVRVNVKISYKVYLFCWKFLNMGMLIYQIRVILLENLKSEPFDAVVE